MNDALDSVYYFAKVDGSNDYFTLYTKPAFIKGARGRLWSWKKCHPRGYISTGEAGHVAFNLTYHPADVTGLRKAWFVRVPQTFHDLITHKSLMEANPVWRHTLSYVFGVTAENLHHAATWLDIQTFLLPRPRGYPPIPASEDLHTIFQKMDPDSDDTDAESDADSDVDIRNDGLELGSVERDGPYVDSDDGAINDAIPPEYGPPAQRRQIRNPLDPGRAVGLLERMFPPKKRKRTAFAFVDFS